MRFHRLICPESAPLASEKESFQWLTSIFQNQWAGESVDFLMKTALGKIKFLSRGESILHVWIVDWHLEILIFPMVLSDLFLELGKVVKIHPQYEASFSNKFQNELFDR